MRGVVTLAAALTPPVDTPLQPELVVIALVVTVGTLLLQGSTLPALAGALDVRGPDPRQDALQEATVLGATTGAGLRLLEGDPEADPGIVEAIRAPAADRVNRSWEWLGTLGPGDDETPAEARARLRMEMIREERADLLRIRDRGSAPPALPRGVPVLSRAGDALGPPARLRDERSGGLLRLLLGPARLRARPRQRPPGDPLDRAGRGVALVLRRRRSRLIRGRADGQDKASRLAGPPPRTGHLTTH
jgi:hypothetical protein